LEFYLGLVGGSLSQLRVQSTAKGIVMAKKKASSKKKSASKKSAGTGGKSKSGQPLLRTQFMADFTHEFIYDSSGKFLWPVAGQSKTAVLADYLTFVTVLMTVGYIEAPAPAASPGSLGDRIATFLANQKWPSQTSIKPKWVKDPGRPTVHLIEIAVILDRLLEAINGFHFKLTARGGGPGGWPPH